MAADLWSKTAFGRYKSIIGDSLAARDDKAQVAEVAIGVKMLNPMISAAKPISLRAQMPRPIGQTHYFSDRCTNAR